MTEWGFSLISIFPHDYRIRDSALIRKNTGQRKPLFRHILRSAMFTKMRSLLKNFPVKIVYISQFGYYVSIHLNNFQCCIALDSTKLKGVMVRNRLRLKFCQQKTKKDKCSCPEVLCE